MAGPIISGGNPRIEAFLGIALLVLLVVIATPELTVAVLDRLPWLPPVFHWLHHFIHAN